ncbi:DUF4129 domain-containing protein [Aquimarina gracilis]|uniref:DUF4129 domain-containing protein n=1 Tax=Aquimarina gracilis TaxID=874422 RepID=A0ABU5ZWK6_9FLAO|nr:DUF4129 domain-containing protein [Aquimarina gracilis]MEB3346256.1 DUF4129 domain-containing protein [Aquimarina gracilis]
MRIFYCFLLIIISSFPVKAQDSIAIANTEEIVYDLDSQKEIKEFDQEQLQEYRNQEDFNYTEYEEVENWWTQFKKWVGQLLQRFFRWLSGGEITGFWAFVLKILPYIIVIAVLFLLGWLFLKVNPTDMLLEKQDPPQIELTEDEDIIQNQDIQQLIHLALQNNNYRLAIRYYYLFVLKKLSDLEFIEWESQKTNTDYIKELSDVGLKDQFKIITKLYDYIWYGSFEVNEKSYKKAEKEFLSISNQIER